MSVGFGNMRLHSKSIMCGVMAATNGAQKGVSSLGLDSGHLNAVSVDMELNVTGPMGLDIVLVSFVVGYKRLEAVWFFTVP